MITKDEKIGVSPPYLGFLILKRIQKRKKITLDELVLSLKDQVGLVNHRQLIFTLIFLYQSGVVDFSEPYIFKI
ncbi:MAG TPA: hypothetical protein VJ579_04920 [Candidatus Paceibacterota bacterium]|nr:hypothetical protein [Candidatus Paceibacterota bacterium]